MADEQRPRHGFRNVFCLGLVSLFTDLSSQMIYPLVPVFLERGLGVPKWVIGVIEGLAESAASLLRTIFGRWSDRTGRRKLFIYLGYGLSAVSKPFLYLATGWHTVLGVRLSDRVGKAIRTPARDALISTSVEPARRGAAFGFHRAMDRLGAVGGPLLAMLVLYLFRDESARRRLARVLNTLPSLLLGPFADRILPACPSDIQVVFFFSFIPAVLALVFVPFARETVSELKTKTALRKSGIGSRAFIVFLISAVVFNLGNSSDAFLILKASETGLTPEMVPLIWVVYNIVCTVSSPIFGTLSDKVGRTPVIIASFLYYAVVYVLFGLAARQWMMWALFASYGVYYGLSAGALRAHIADLVDEEHRATAYGIFNTGVGLALIPASILFGAVWSAVGSRPAFFTSAAFSLLGFLIFLASLAVKPKTPPVTP